MKYSRKKVEPGKINRRIIAVGVFFTLLYFIIAGRIVYLQVFCCDMLANRASGEYKRTYVASGKRGTIYDRRCTELAVTVDAMSVGLHPALISRKEELAPKLAKALNMDTCVVKHKLASRRSFIWLKRLLSNDEATAVREIGLEPKAVEYVATQKRIYPNKSLAAQLIGFTGIDGNGLEGIEYNCDEELRGASISRTILMDAKQQCLGAEDESPVCADGDDIILTIDATIQYIAETALKEAVADSQAASGMAVVMDPNTGEVLAMANYPFFDLNDFADYRRNDWRNRIITDAFEPGSIMKVFLAAGSIESGLCTPDSVFYCEEGAYRIQGHCINDSHRYGLLTMREIIKVSSNIGAVKISERIGKKRLWETLRRFGFDSKSDIKCPGGTEGLLSPYTQWTDIDAGTIAFGQGICASAIQLVTAVSAIANGGLLIKPYVVGKIIQPDGQVVRERGREIVRRVISERTAGYLKDMMTAVTTAGGTGEQAAVEGYTVCGKTGTAQKLNEEGQYTDKDYIASFLGFAPAKNPRVAVLVVVDLPQKGYYGGVVAAPAFRKIVHETLNYFGVPPETDKSRKNMMVLAHKEVNG